MNIFLQRLSSACQQTTSIPAKFGVPKIHGSTVHVHTADSIPEAPQAFPLARTNTFLTVMATYETLNTPHDFSIEDHPSPQKSDCVPFAGNTSRASPTSNSSSHPSPSTFLQLAHTPRKPDCSSSSNDYSCVANRCSPAVAASSCRCAVSAGAPSARDQLAAWGRRCHSGRG